MQSPIWYVNKVLRKTSKNNYRQENNVEQHVMLDMETIYVGMCAIYIHTRTHTHIWTCERRKKQDKNLIS